MDLEKKNFSPLSIDKFPSNKSYKNILIPKINMNDPLKSKLLLKSYKQIKLPSIKSNSTKSTIRYKNMINDFKDYSLSNKKYHIKNNIISLESKDKDDENLTIQKIYEYNNKNILPKEQIENNEVNLKKSSSAIFPENTDKLFSKYKISNILSFHKNLMLENQILFNKRMKERKSNIINEEKNNKDSYINSISHDKSKKGIKTGIFGPSNNIVSVIRAKMERLKYDNMYKGVNEEIKELIKDEIMDAQVKLGRKPENLIIIKEGVKPLYIKKMDKYRYLSSMNKIREINQRAIIPVLEKDQNIMLKLFNDAFDVLRNKRVKNQ